MSGVSGVSDETTSSWPVDQDGKTNELGRLPSLYFCAAPLEKGQTKGGLDALHPFPHSCGLSSNRWRDGHPLRHCSVDAEHLVIFSVFGGSMGRLTTTLAHGLAI